MRRQAEREDGQLLILPSDFSEEVGGLSYPTHGSSGAKVATNSGNANEAGKNCNRAARDCRRGRDY